MPSLRHVLITLTALAAVACSSSKPEAPAQAATSSGAEASPAPLPTEPAAVLADGASTLLVADANALRASPHYGFVQSWLTQSACAPAGAAELLARTHQLVAAEWPAAGQVPPSRLAVLRGTLRPEDARVALQLATALTGRNEGPITERIAGRMQVAMQGRASASVIGDQLLVVGDHAAVEAALALAEGDARAKLFDGELIRKNGVHDALATRTVVLVSKPEDVVVRRTGKALATFGLPKDLIAGTVVGLVSLDAAGAALEVRVEKAEAASAANAADLVRARLGQLGLLARLAGLPPALDRAEVSVEGASLRARVAVSHDEIAVVTSRLQELVSNEGAACATASAAP